MSVIYHFPFRIALHLGEKVQQSVISRVNVPSLFSVECVPDLFLGHFILLTCCAEQRKKEKKKPQQPDMQRVEVLWLKHQIQNVQPCTALSMRHETIKMDRTLILN